MASLEAEYVPAGRFAPCDQKDSGVPSEREKRPREVAISSLPGQPWISGEVLFSAVPL